MAHPLHLMSKTIIVNLVQRNALFGACLPVYLRNQCETTKNSIWVPITLICIPPNLRAGNIKFLAIPPTSRYTLCSDQGRRSKYNIKPSHSSDHIKLGSSDNPCVASGSNPQVLLPTEFSNTKGASFPTLLSSKQKLCRNI